MARTSKPKQDFEAALGELETIVARMESGQISLDEALAQFQRGSELIQSCQATLDAAEAKLAKLAVTTAAETEPDSTLDEAGDDES
jgi:exodeoxyribonuclease VII small subunit